MAILTDWLQHIPWQSGTFGLLNCTGAGIIINESSVLEKYADFGYFRT